jgi:hypothetical protein
MMLKFTRSPEYEKPGGKTIVWAVKNPSGELLGTIAYMAHWRRYVLDPYASVFDSSCLREIAEFMDEHKMDRRPLTPL